MKMKPNCRRCYYGGVYDHEAHLASCDCKMVAEKTVSQFDPLFRKERKYVSRNEWEEKCDCENFIPHLSEADGDYELEAVCTFSTSFDCPFCGCQVIAHERKRVFIAFDENFDENEEEDEDDEQGK